MSDNTQGVFYVARSAEDPNDPTDNAATEAAMMAEVLLERVGWVAGQTFEAMDEIMRKDLPVSYYKFTVEKVTRP